MVSRDVERLCEITGTSMIFLTRVGYKSFNRLGRHRLYTAFVAGTDGDIAPDTLRLGVDGLKDPYTLLGRRLADSPHLALMRAFESGGDPTHTEYAERLTQGTLSQGLPVPFDEGYVRERFRACDAEIRGGAVQTVKTITLVGSRYILDGRHRAAHSLLRGARVHCVDVTPIIFDSDFRFFHYLRPSRRPAVFRRHLDVLGPAYAQPATAKVSPSGPARVHA
jgi:hypothetical protein